ncbi:MAG: MaoC family dehydratase [Ectothiorhodospiraceae bacterium]|nr:MaoC family dehydratase [Ectothiorhodospiraceae bacterium]
MDGRKQLFLEDFLAGRVWTGGPRAIDQDEIVAFARAYDPQYFHLDPELARSSPLGVLCASGIQTFAIAHRLMVDALLGQTDVVAGGGMDQFRMRLPVVPGDRLYVRVEVQGVKPHSRRPDRGWVIFLVHLTREDGETVLDYQTTILVMRREPLSKR